MAADDEGERVLSIELHELSLRMGGRARIEGVSLRLESGRVTACLGPNGAGKSSLLRLLAGELSPSGGEIRWEGQPLATLSPEAQARRRAVLPQLSSLRFGFPVRTVVGLGRLPHGDEHAASGLAAVDRALQAHDLVGLADRPYTHLSGGEKQRVQAARAFAQVDLQDREGIWLLLDEPTSALDLVHQQDLMAGARQHAAAGGGVVVVLHDPNLAAAFADDVLLLRRGQLVAFGPTRKLLTSERLTTLYDTPVDVGDWNGQTVIRARPPS